MNVQMDFDVSKETWDKNKADLLQSIHEDESLGETNSKTKLAQMHEVEKYTELNSHWRGLQEDFQDLDKGFELVEDTLKQGRSYFETTTVKTMDKLVDRNNEINKQ